MNVADRSVLGVERPVLAKTRPSVTDEFVCELVSSIGEAIAESNRSNESMHGQQKKSVHKRLGGSRHSLQNWPVASASHQNGPGEERRLVRMRSIRYPRLACKFNPAFGAY